MALSASKESIQIAKEDTPGDPPAAGYYQLRASKLENQDENKFDTFKASGSAHHAVSNLTTEETKITLTGRADYNDMYIWLSGAVCEPVTTRLIPTTGLAFEHIYEPDMYGPNARFSYTMKKGNASYAEQVSNIVLSQIGLKLPRTGNQEIAGAGFGGALKSSIADAIAMHPTPTKMKKAPMPAPHFAMALATSAAGLAAAPLIAAPGPFMSEWMMDAIANAVYGYNRSTSFGDTVEGDPKGTAKLKLPITAQSVGLRTTMKAGDIVFMRIQALGAIIEATTRYELTIDTALFITSAPSKNAEQNALAHEYGFEWAEDENSDLGTKIKLVNTFAGF